jgi:hypothetical protein
MLALTELEAAVLELLLEGDSAVLIALRRQLAVAVVREREFSGVGFFTTFDVPPDTPRAPVPPKFSPFGDVGADIEGLRHGAGFLLFVDDGYLHMLEGYTYDEPWPDRPGRFLVQRIQIDRF